MPGEVKRETIKQAKRSFKARGQPSLSNQEIKQLQRAQQLDQRAWRVKEQEKRRAEVAKKRAEKEKEDKLERERARLGSQRRCDRFGYQSSQFHLGRFFKAGGGETDVSPKKTEVDLGPTEGQDSESDETEDFLESDFDDPTILDALEQSTNTAGAKCNTAPARKSITQMPSPPVSLSDQRVSAEPQTIQLAVSVSSPSTGAADRRGYVEVKVDRTEDQTELVNEDLRSFWDELDSSTQIARDLNTPQPVASRSPPSRSSSFGIDDMDLTEEDLKRLDPPEPAREIEDNSTLMPPPPRPRQRALPAPRHTTSFRVGHKSMVPQVKAEGPPIRNLWKPCSIDHGFTISELESWVDDDIVLTQVTPG